MRINFVAACLLVALATGIPASAQSDRTDRRVEKLEQEIKALQRRVFPNGATVQPEIAPGTAALPVSGVPASSALADLTARVDALERQLAQLTGQAEENGNRLRRLEENVTNFQAEYRREQAERAAPETPDPEPAVSTRRPAVTPAPTTPATTTPAPASSGTSGADPAEEAYNAGFRLWEQKRYAEAQRALEAMARQYPEHRLASWAKNLEGRAYLDEGKPASAAKIFLANYEGNPRGERAADSLFVLGQSLARLNKMAEACQAYGELTKVYGSSIRAYLRERLPEARATARCTS